MLMFVEHVDQLCDVNCRRASCSFTVEIGIPGLVAIFKMILLLVKVDLLNLPFELALRTTRDLTITLSL